ncbi:MAG TPA: S1 RNA-binding domain-containing protein, partial [Pirellulales bacterium]|nr:S1 RNA-binding domain-containing protein [Pirellulales bacterium]
MVNRNLIRGLDANQNDWELELSAALAGTDPNDIEWGGSDITLNQIVQGRVLRVEGDMVLIDVGYKSEGTIPLNEWDAEEPPPEPGQTVKVLIEDIEDATAGLEEAGMISLSKRKAEKIEAWMKVMETVHENDIVTGTVT